jgi:hypothetical protein
MMFFDYIDKLYTSIQKSLDELKPDNNNILRELYEINELCVKLEYRIFQYYQKNKSQYIFDKYIKPIDDLIYNKINSYHFRSICNTNNKEIKYMCKLIVSKYVLTRCKDYTDLNNVLLN